LNPDEHGYNGAEGAIMGQQEKAVNNGIANWLYRTCRPTSMLDIGSAYPYLAYCFNRLGVKEHALDGVYKTDAIHVDIPVNTQAVNWEDLEDGGYDTWKGVDLITMIHVLEHFEDPVACLERVYDNLSSNGTLYVRGPNKDVAGIERDHTEGHALIHPSIFGNESILYAMKKVGFYLHWVEHMNGHGQSSWIFKKRPPTVSLFMIVKNEEKDLINCLSSIKDHVDEMIILDTGSTDKTVELATEFGAKVFHSKKFSSETEYKDFNFAEARNEALNHANGDWLFWMDADDRLECDDWHLSPEFDAFHIRIKYGGTEYNQARIFRNNYGVHFRGAVHEYPVIDACRTAVLEGCAVRHKAEEKTGRVGRNIAILETEWSKHPNDKRTLFYLANAYRENGRFDEAIRTYRNYIARGGNFHDELVLAKYYVALSHYCKRDYTQALKAAHEVMAFDDRWGEPYSLAGECYFFKRQFKKAAHYFKIALDMPFPQTTMFVEKNRYREAPRLWLSYCYAELGEMAKAREWAKGNKARELELASKTYVIEVNRPGALGDVLATTPAVKELRKKYPDAHIRYVTHKNSKDILKHNPDINEVAEEPGYADRKIDFSYPMNEGYPYKPMNRHLCQYFAENAGVKLSEGWKPVLNILSEDSVKLEHKKPTITFAVRTGWSRYKEWPLERWQKLILKFPDYQWIQLGAAGETLIPGAQHMCGKLSLRESFSVLQQSTLFVGLDSVFNHASAALGTDAIIMFGSTSPLGSGYDSNTNLWSEYECSPCYKEDNAISVHPMPPCPYAHKCMQDYMSVDQVAAAIAQKLNILI
jgi:ADP-heptose:LPS heptosyltransferase/glycosyltransferase involved in cell wall biosynthesis